MKKVFRILEETFLIVSVVTLFVGALIGFIPTSSAPAPSRPALETGLAGGSLVLSTAVIIIVGIFLKHTENKISNRVGEALLLAGYVINGITVLATVINSYTLDGGTIVILIAVILFAISYLCRFINWFIDRVIKEHDDTKEAK